MKFGEGHNSGERQTDLRGQAVLDALGLLDEVESAQFERAFHDAPPSVQADLRAVQAAVAVDPAFLADGEPSPDLRLKTLARVMTAVEQQEVQVVHLVKVLDLELLVLLEIWEPQILEGQDNQEHREMWELLENHLAHLE